MPLRVRQVLDKIGANGRRTLIKYLPPYSLPENAKGTFPTAILQSFVTSESNHSEVGILTEKLLFCPNLTKEYVMQCLPDDIPNKQKIEKSKTTNDYILKIQKTRDVLSEFLSNNGGFGLNEVLLEQELVGTHIIGRPDGIYRNATHQIVIEIKTSSKLDTDITYFMEELCAYLSLCQKTPSNLTTFGILVLPLQSTIIVIESTNGETIIWTNYQRYLKVLEDKSKTIIESAPNPTLNMLDIFGVNQLIEYYSIGNHVSKQKTLVKTVENMKPGVPYQIFLGNNISTKLNIDENDLLEASQFIQNNNISLYIHAPYIINLAETYENNWNIDFMIKTMGVCSRLGAKGVVVHVGKSVGYEVSHARNIMFNGVTEILEHVKPNCPLLLETPAGQGTEMLRDCIEFMDFIKEIRQLDEKYKDRIGACVDTCHVFACGYKPSDYIKSVFNSEILKLVHYNDSNETCGSCKDRHAMVGQGHIGIGEMTAVADFCGMHNIHMVIE